MKHKSINSNIKSNILIVTIIITFVFLVVNVSIYFLNNSFLINKVKEENQAFLDITTHIMNENDLAIALEYIEHYTHIHQVEIEVLDSDQTMIFSSNISHRYTYQYQIDTNQGIFTIFIDNTESVTVSAFEQNTLYVNIVLFIIYLISILVLYILNKRSLGQIEIDIEHVLSLINQEELSYQPFHFDEFTYIYRTISNYVEEIDFLNEQKEFNMKGLAHDIKTPLTIIYHYLQKVEHGEIMTKEEAQKGFEAAKHINQLVEHIMMANQNAGMEELDISVIIKDKLFDYLDILQDKNITLSDQISSGIVVAWRRKDIERVLDNLISNAYHYSKESSTVSVKLNQNGKIALEVISEPETSEKLDPTKVFKKGYRGQHSSYSQGKGFGLYITRLLVESAGGTIALEQTNKNVKFTITL